MEENLQEKNRIHSMAVIIMTALSLGAITESITMGWEFWMPPLIGAAIIAMWWMHITQYSQARFRENFYLIMNMVVTFYYGIHYNNIFGVIVVSTIMMGVTALLGRLIFLKLYLYEYYVIMAVQVVLSIRAGTFSFSFIDISKLGLQFISAVFINVILRKITERNDEKSEEITKLHGDRKEYDHDMEDFLVNISHELRTPLNVINGLTDIILRREDRKDILSIRNAGLRMASQIEDIQDYSEIQRNDIQLENDRYMITSVIHNILTNYNAMDFNKKLEFVIDLDPTVPSVMRGDIRKILKIIYHLLENAFKFTNSGGVCLKIKALKKEYGVNLIIEVTDTGIGMTQKDIESVQNGLYQANKKRTRSTGGIGLGFSIVYGLVRRMNGFVRIESEKNKGTTVRVSIFQEVIDMTPCLGFKTDRFVNAVLFDMPDKGDNMAVKDMYRNMGKNLAAGLRVNLYMAGNIEEVKRMIAKGKVTHVFMGDKEYMDNKSYVRNLARENVTMTVITDNPSMESRDENIQILRKPVYGLHLVQILNGDLDKNYGTEDYSKPVLEGVRALVVDDEPMNLVVARGLFGEYKMIVDTAESGMESLDMYEKNDYDVVFMDHMMPEMDGVETMKRLKDIAEQNNKKLRIIALTANAVSGAKEMFISEGFDGFISKPINLTDFERVLSRVMSDGKTGHDGGIK